MVGPSWSVSVFDVGIDVLVVRSWLRSDRGHSDRDGDRPLLRLPCDVNHSPIWLMTCVTL